MGASCSACFDGDAPRCWGQRGAAAMLTALTIKNIVLIDRLALRFGDGLTVLTGETGAGKSILLDALALALGARADAGLVRSGCDSGQVTAEFALPPGHPAQGLLTDQDIELDDEHLVLRRTVRADGRSRAHINDQPVSAGLLRRIGETLVEVHGQHDERGLLDPRGHRRLLDQFAGHADLLAAVADAFQQARGTEQALEEVRSALETARKEDAYLRHMAAELEALAPKEGEETDLAERRARLMQAHTLADDLAAFDAILSGDDGIEVAVGGLIRRLSRLDPDLQARLEPFAAPLDRAGAELAEAARILERLRADLDADPEALEAAEARLFDLRAAARKHQVPVSDLPAVAAAARAKLAALDAGAEALHAAEQAHAQARGRLERAVAALSNARRAAAERLSTAVMAELPDLKLDKARFQVAVEALEQDRWGPTGGDQVAFEVATNPGMPPGALIKIASGGELARFILALKVALAGQGEAPTLIFDEVDRGIGGATADAVGARLARLARSAQLLVVTHSPQVAACGQAHLHISKAQTGEAVRTVVAALDPEQRREEIARMLSGATITDAARTAADSLMARA